jgi:hypothetical protein
MNWSHSFRLLSIGCSSLLFCCTPILRLVVIAYLVYGIHTYSNYYHINWKLFLDNLSLISYTVKPLSTVMVCVVFPTSIIRYFWSSKIAYTSSASLYHMYCFSKFVFLVSFIHSGVLALQYSWKHHFQEKCGISNMFLEHTVVVTFPCQ